jgi:indolepyruvate ferredoxin oxidoreductase
VQSNCVSVEPLETEFGRKRRINQSSCNKDFSCVKGFCPSFVTVSGASLRKARPTQSGKLEQAVANLPEPEIAGTAEPYDILVTGIGGTGVVTIGALLGMAAHIEGKGVTVLDFTGISQKNGAVMSHVRIAAKPEDLNAVRIAAGAADLLLGCDMVVAASPDALGKLDNGGTTAIVNSHLTPTAGFTLNPDLDMHAEELKGLIRDAAGGNRTEFVEATEIATALLGDAIATNLFLMGYAYQRGALPVSREALEKAIELNGVAVEANKRTFALGRLAAQDLKLVEQAARPVEDLPEPIREETLEEIVARRVEFLTGYQDAAYARRYADVVRKVETAELDKAKGFTGLAEAVARYLFKLMAYKDEYEVARLYTDGAFLEKLNRQFDGDLKLKFQLAPPLFAQRDPDTGHLQKREYGPWIFTAFKLLAKMKGLRGGRFDVFGYTEERRTERRLIDDYIATVDELLAGLTPDNHALAVEIARIPEKIRGFGHVKERHLDAAKAEEAQLLDAWRNPTPHATAAE